jgi:mycothione reductase
MEGYDAIVVGTGRGLSVAYSAAAEGLKVAVVEKGPPGGTCLNVGCIPSKLMISAADRLQEIKESSDFGITADISHIDFAAVMEYMRDYVATYRETRRRSLEADERIGFFPTRGEFIAPYSIRVGDEEIRSDLIFLASGARPAMPSIKGLDRIQYLTNETVFDLKSIPASMIIVGGGYIGVEFAHFFSAMGSQVMVVEAGERLLTSEEPEISDLLKESLAERMKIHTGAKAARVAAELDMYTVTCDCADEAESISLKAESIMIAAGRKPNSDLLKVEKTGVESDERGFIKVDEFYRTSKDGIWAFGDAIGKAMFTHAGSREAELAWDNAYNGAKRKMNYLAVPHAVFSRPQIASVGLTQSKASEKYDIMVGRAEYRDTVKGAALHQKGTFAKAIVEAGSRRILGFHIIGPYAPILIQEITGTIARGGTADDVTKGLHIHPALGELIPATLKNLVTV